MQLFPLPVTFSLHAWLLNATPFKVLEGVSETERSDSSTGTEEERVEEEIEKWEEEEEEGEPDKMKETAVYK